MIFVPWNFMKSKLVCVEYSEWCLTHCTPIHSGVKLCIFPCSAPTLHMYITYPAVLLICLLKIRTLSLTSFVRANKFIAPFSALVSSVKWIMFLKLITYMII